MDSLNTLHLVLASSSPRRKLLLEQLGLAFNVMVSDVDESLDAAFSPELMAERLALHKAQAIAKTVSDAFVIGADTLVVDEHGILGKPRDKAEAFRMLRRLSGHVHRVVTGVAVVSTYPSGQTLVKHQSTQVKFTTLSDLDIERYIASGEPFDKAGAYAIQEKGAVFVEWIHGCYNNVVGLPVFLLMAMLKKMSEHLE